MRSVGRSKVELEKIKDLSTLSILLKAREIAFNRFNRNIEPLFLRKRLQP